MNTLITGPPLWFMVEWLMIHLPEELTEEEQDDSQEFYIVFASTHTCSVCRRQFTGILKVKPPKFRTRNEACEYYLLRHDDVNERLHKKRFTDQKGFSLQKWMSDFTRDPKSNARAFQIAVLDFITSFTFCFSENESRENRYLRCKNIREFLAIVKKMCTIVIATIQCKEERDIILATILFIEKIQSNLKSENLFDGHELLQTLVYSYRKLEAYVRPPWAFNTPLNLRIEDDLDYFGFLRRYLPVIATGPVIVSGPNAGQPATQSSNDELQNPTGCR